VNAKRHDPAGQVTPDQPEAYASALRSYFRKRAHPADVEDLVQEVLLRMHGRQAKSEIDNIGGYIFTVAAHVLIARRKRGPVVEPSPDDGIDAITPERIVLARREVDRVVGAIQDLPPRTRDIFVAHRFEDMTYAAIGRRFGISVSAVEKHIMLALRELSSVVRGQP
jgi:RNA polymerase sigma factor (sigma-70 family)